MAFADVVWAFKDFVTSAKLSQMVENVRAHDHRADGTQGAFLGEWATGRSTLPAAAAGATITVDVLFPGGRFTDAATISCNAFTADASVFIAYVVTAQTTTSGTRFAFRNTSGAAVAAGVPFHWQAMRRP